MTSRPHQTQTRNNLAIPHSDNQISAMNQESSQHYITLQSRSSEKDSLARHIDDQHATPQFASIHNVVSSPDSRQLNGLESTNALTVENLSKIQSVKQTHDETIIDLHESKSPQQQAESIALQPINGKNDPNNLNMKSNLAQLSSQSQQSNSSSQQQLFLPFIGCNAIDSACC
jgi:subtilase family serine protease